jgi:hypothetical protein
MTLNDRRRILWLLTMSGTMALFCLDGARGQSQSIVLNAPPPPAVTSFSARPSASGLEINDVLPGLLLPHWRLCVAKVLEGDGDCKLLPIGDSTTLGHGDSTTGTSVTAKSYPADLVAMLNARGIPAALGLARARPTVISGVSDNRWAPDVTWALFGTGGFGFAGLGVMSNGGVGGAAIVFTPGGSVPYDSFTVWYMPSVGTLTAQATGGTLVSVNAALPTGISSFTAVAGSAGTGNSVTISGTGTLLIVGVEPFHSTIRRVRVGTIGIGGSNTIEWSNSANAFSSLQAIQAYAPDLSIISLGINDAGIVLPANFSTNMAAIATATKLSGDTILMSMPPSGSVTTELPYQPVFRALAESTASPLVDVFARWGGIYQTALMFDNLHPNNYGYRDMAAAVNALLLRVN